MVTTTFVLKQRALFKLLFVPSFLRCFRPCPAILNCWCIIPRTLHVFHTNSLHFPMRFAPSIVLKHKIVQGWNFVACTLAQALHLKKIDLLFQFVCGKWKMLPRVTIAYLFLAFWFQWVSVLLQGFRSCKKNKFGSVWDKHLCLESRVLFRTSSSRDGLKINKLLNCNTKLSVPSPYIESTSHTLCTQLPSRRTELRPWHGSSLFQSNNPLSSFLRQLPIASWKKVLCHQKRPISEQESQNVWFQRRWTVSQMSADFLANGWGSVSQSFNEFEEKKLWQTLTFRP